MDKKRTKSREITLTRYLRITYGIFAGIAASILIVLLSLGIVYVVKRDDNVLTALAIILPIGVVLIFIFVVILMKNAYDVFYKNLYTITKRNYENLRKDKKELLEYQSLNIVEFEELNNSLKELSSHNKNSVILSPHVNYTRLPLEYFDKRNHYINEQSFRKYIREIIYCTQSFRNGVVSISYDDDCDIDDVVIKGLAQEINKIFTNEGTLVVLKDNHLGYYVYIPKIESISFLKEILNTFIQKLVITKKTISGIELVAPRINAVIYPYSDINDIFSDLEFAERGSREINIYIPTHYENINTSLLHSSMNLNNVTKLVSQVAAIKEGEGDFDDFLANIGEAFKDICTYYSIEQAGVLLYDRERKKSGGSVCVTLNDNIEPLFKKRTAVSQELVDAIVESADDDGSYYFSSRSKVNANLGKKLDIYGIKSGFLYQIKDHTSSFVGAIYFVNTEQEELKLNSYMQEGLLVISTMIGTFVKNAMKNQEISEMVSREYNLLKMSNVRSYTIDKQTFVFTKLSPALQMDFPSIKEGQVCYKAMFGYDKPCAHCPLLTKQKTVKTFNGVQYEVSYSINTKMSNYIELVLNKVNQNDYSHNRFDPDLLINSYYSFTERLRNLYLSESKGYVVLMKIDNLETLLQELGNEGYSFLVRCFTHDINEKLLKDSEIYLYKNNTLAIIYSEIGKLDVVDNIEKVYEYSKKNYLSSGHNLQMTYEAIKFPQEHSNYDDMIRHLEIVNRQFESSQKDVMYIEENEFLRPASREDYILSIINQATINKNFIIKAQPVIRGEDKTIFGAEVLIRLGDEYRSSLLNTEEMIYVAANNNKLSIISDMLIDYVGSLVKQFGLSTFKTSGFTRMSINADYNYFKEENFRTNIIESINKYHFPKNFLTFEITEKDFAKHYEDMKNVISQLHENDINFVVDHYTGEALSFDKVKALGCNEVKVDRKIVNDIDVSSDKFEALKSIMVGAKEAGVNLTLVGIENSQQYSLAKGVNQSVAMQGYYFHHPLDKNELIEALRLKGY